MSVVKVLSAVVILLLSSLACEQAVVTVTPTTVAEAVTTPDNTPPPTLRPSPSPTVTAEADTATIRATVYVRQAADAASAEVGSLETGQTVEVLACDGSWCEIEYMFEDTAVRGYVFRGCTSNNPEKLSCEVRQ
jgi:uncharacterized protein YgiM (DUF1202 family)